MINVVYFRSRDIAAIAICASLWGVLNPIFSPIFFRMTGLPFLCDLMGFSILTLAAWWTRKFGATTIVGLIATVINFIFNPTGTQILGFTAASIVFDVAVRLIGYDKAFKNPTFGMLSIVSVSILSAAVAGLIIGTFFMAGSALTGWSFVFIWAGLHAVGGVIGGVIGVLLVTALISRGIQTQIKQTNQ